MTGVVKFAENVILHYKTEGLLSPPSKVVLECVRIEPRLRIVVEKVYFAFNPFVIWFNVF